MATLWVSGISEFEALMQAGLRPYAASWGTLDTRTDSMVESCRMPSSARRNSEKTGYKVPVSSVGWFYGQRKKSRANPTPRSLEGAPSADDARAEASQVLALDQPGREPPFRIMLPGCREECRPKPPELPCRVTPRTSLCPSSAPFANDARAYDWFHLSPGHVNRLKSPTFAASL